MKIKALAILLALCAVLMTSCGGSGDGNGETEDLGAVYSTGLAYKINENDPTECTVTGIGTCTDKNISVPPTIDGKTVTAISDKAFAKRANFSPAPINPSSARVEASSVRPLTDAIIPGDGYQFGTDLTPSSEIESITLPLTVKEIGEEAFCGCEELKTINVNENISSIGKDAFKDTAYFNNKENWDGEALYISNYLITVSASYVGEFTVRPGTVMIADQAFYKCEGVTSVNIAESVKAVGEYVFYGCVSLTHLNNKTEILFDSTAFEGCFSYKDYIPGGGGSNKDEEKPHVPLYDLIDKAAFDSMKEIPTDFHSVTTLLEGGSSQTVSLIMNELGFYYTLEYEGAVQKELYGKKTPSGYFVFMKLEDGWYRTEEYVPEINCIPSELEFEMLEVYGDDNAYSFHSKSEEGMEKDSRIELAFKGGTLSYICYVGQDFNMKTEFTDYGCATLPDFPDDGVVWGTIVDINGNVIENAE